MALLPSTKPELSAPLSGPDGHTIRVGGDVDPVTARELERLLREAAHSGSGRVVVDLSGCRRLSGSLLLALLRGARGLRWRNRQLTIVCPDPELAASLRFVGLDELVDVTA